MIILDTNVVSDLMRGGSVPVVQWLTTMPEGELYSTAVTRAEIGYGLARLPAGRRREDLVARAHELFERFSDRWLPFDSPAADEFGAVVADREAAGRPISAPDAQIASIARARRATLATRKTKDFAGCGVLVLDPFAHGG